MVKFDIDKAATSNMTNRVDDFEVDSTIIKEPTGQKEQEFMVDNGQKNWDYFNGVPDLKSALLMKGIWDVGKGYEPRDARTKVILDHIKGRGKESFEDILFNMDVNMRIFGDAFAEIVRDKPNGKIINIIVLNPINIKVIVNPEGTIERYEQMNNEKKTINKWKPNEIFHLSNNRLANQILGISDIKGMEETLLANEESFADVKRMMHHQGKPFILWKLKTDDDAKIAKIVTKIDKMRNLSEDVFVPDDDDTISWEVVQVNLSQMVLSWRDDIRNKFYRTIMLPQVVPGGAGQGTESESKVIIFAFEQVVERAQRYIEKQVQNQLFLTIDLIHPASIKPEMQADESKDVGQLGFQPGETTAGVGE